mmetsp:Transcript_30431/g.56193  ORF Transcript_30431/g.56193 Transcript_30431/m.56193 type:complete len:322 (+) Transcript_30431:191-1156(+)|eukprot:CAMPEP_0196154430 /NCGR_PEP_ID=MMETSP0910-20130528/38858_1 /TAXON_ID=49265 /ORGANISM="Thalassiosira rotula, Strain GSO102" /LENGTH=321 /DNA_ID=CAMNT_0041418447 /DNA_START=137 /DNA_END=1102 /DNA_ORIENTATION=-
MPLSNDIYSRGESDTFMFKPIKSWERTQEQEDSIEVTMSESSMSMAQPFGLTENIDTTLGCCTEDLFINMCESQHDYVSPANYTPDASYIPYRRYLVDWMSDVGEQCNLHTTTVHVSILLLDKIFRAQEIPRSHWQLMATACLSIAAKYEEAEEHCPPIPDLLRLTKLSAVGHTSLTFREGEVEVLRHLGWKLRAIPPLHVIGYFLAKGVVFDDDTWQGRALIDKIPKYIKKYADFFCNLTLQEYSFQQYLPTHLAAAILLASRVALQITPRWRPELQLLTGYDEAEITPAFKHVWSYYEEQFPGHGTRSISPRSVTTKAF